MPSDGRIMYVTPTINTLIKQADKITRSLDVSAQHGIDLPLLSPVINTAISGFGNPRATPRETVIYTRTGNIPTCSS